MPEATLAGANRDEERPPCLGGVGARQPKPKRNHPYKEKMDRLHLCAPILSGGRDPNATRVRCALGSGSSAFEITDMPFIDTLPRRAVFHACILAVVTPFASASPADAFRAPRKAEFRAIAAAVKRNPDGAYYCAKRRTTWISTVRRRWALAQMRSNCGLGSQTVRFFLKRRAGRRGWRLVERHYERLGTGRGVPCGSRRTPPDIRCGPLIVHDRLS